MALKSQLESLLFISSKPMSAKQLAEIMKAEEKEILTAGDQLMAEYKENARGIEIIKDGSKLQMVSSPSNARLVQEFIKDETMSDLTRPSLEALTVIAYRAPISKTDLDRIRGVNCSLILRNLMIRGLVETKFDKKKGAQYYSPSLDFLRYLGINNTSELPDYERLSRDDSLARVLAAPETEPTGA